MESAPATVMPARRTFEILQSFISDSSFVFQAPWLAAPRSSTVVKLAAYSLDVFLKRQPTVGRPYPGALVEFSSFDLYLNHYRDLFIRGSCSVALTNPEPVIFDCGASIGMSTLYFKRRFPRATIVAFEPGQATFTRLTNNVRRNRLTNVELVNAAVSDREGEATLSSCIEEDPGATLTACASEKSEPVRTVRLTPFLNKFRAVDLLKLDIEGSEYDVLTDLESQGSLEFVRNLVIEYHVSKCPAPIDQALNVLSRNGFRYRLGAHYRPGFTIGQPHICMIYAARLPQ